MTDNGTPTPESKHPHRPFIPHFIRIFAIPIILGWVALTVVVNVAVPRLEVVGEQHSAPIQTAPQPEPAHEAPPTSEVQPIPATESEPAQIVQEVTKKPENPRRGWWQRLIQS